jgi:hypothetical protein
MPLRTFRAYAARPVLSTLAVSLVEHQTEQVQSHDEYEGDQAKPETRARRPTPSYYADCHSRNTRDESADLANAHHDHADADKP